VKLGIPPFGNPFKMSQSFQWDIWSLGPYIGADVPITDKTRFSVNFTYNFFFEESDDFSGPSVSLFFKRRF
jgi:hypothetical protein